MESSRVSMSVSSAPSLLPPPLADEAPSILAKAFELLSAFTHEHRVLTLTELSKSTGLPKSTVHRLLARLEDLGIVEHYDNKYRLGIRLIQMVAAMPVEGMCEIALPHLALLRSWSQENVHFAVMRGSDVVFLETLFSAKTRSRAGDVGARIPAHITSLGRAIMAYLPEEELDFLLSLPLAGMTQFSMTEPEVIRAELKVIRRSKVAFQKDEVTIGMGSIGAPIMIKGRPMGAVAVQFNTSEGFQESIVNAVKLTAHRIAEETRALLAEGHGDWFPHGF